MYRKILICLIIVAVLVFVTQEVIKSHFGLGWPVKSKTITSPFGNRIHPITHVKTFHNGIDIEAVSGTPILSPGPGVVTKRFDNNSGGNQLVVKHDNGYSTGYAHLSAFSVKVGDRVKKNQQLGLTGSTGNVTGPHLHLTVKNASGDYLDPQIILS